MSRRSRTIQANFSRGEVSPRLHGHVDLDLFRSGLARCENFIVLPHGILTRRPGTKYCGGAKNNDKKVRLEPFIYARDDAYCLEIGEFYIRFWREDGLVLDGGSNPYEVTTPYTEAQLFDLSLAQNDDDVYIAHPDHAPQVLHRNDHADWTFGAVSFTQQPTEWVAGNYPRVTGFYQQRLGFSSTPNERKTFWFSRLPTSAGAARLTDFTTGTDDTHALKFRVLAGRENAVEWMVDGRALYVGTSGATRTITGAQIDEPITPSSIRDRKQGQDGGAFIQPVETSTAVLFMGKSGRRLHEFRYALEEDRFVSPDVSEASEHITLGGIVDMAYTQDPNSINWMVRADGQLVGVTYVPDQGVIAFHRHLLGGASSTTLWGFVESVASTPRGSVDTLYIAVRRQINGATVRSIECLEQIHAPSHPDDRQGMFYVDSGGQYSGSAVGTVGGGTHIQGETIDVLADGAAQPQVPVQSDGSFTMQNSKTAGEITFGLPYRAVAETLRPLVDEQTGIAIGRESAIRVAGIDVMDTADIGVGSAPDTTTKVNFRRVGNAFGKAPPLYTGDISEFVDGGFEDNASLAITAEGPVSCTVRALSLEVSTG